jgi:hypothetical protein
VTSFNGSAYATLSSSPTGIESLFTVKCKISDCVEKVEGFSAMTTVIGGFAIFEVNYICLLDLMDTLTFILR